MSTDRLFSPKIPPDLEHASLVREEALEWLESNYHGILSFSTAEVLRMVGEQNRRWLITRLREHGIGNQDGFNLPGAADALAVLFLRRRGVKFREAVDAVIGRTQTPKDPKPSFGGVWNRLIMIAFKRLRRRVSARLLASAIFSLLPDSELQPNCLIIVQLHGKSTDQTAVGVVEPVDHDYVYRATLQRPAPLCWVISPLREALPFDRDQSPIRSEVTSRQFVGLHVVTELEDYELLLGTTKPAQFNVDKSSFEFVGRILDIVFHHIAQYAALQAASGSIDVAEPAPDSPDDLQLWLITQILDMAYPGSLCEISELSVRSDQGRLLASSATKPWEPSPWSPPKNLEMLSGYASRIGVPLVVPQVKPPWTPIIESVETQMRFLTSRSSDGSAQNRFSAMALPIVSNSGTTAGALYMLLPEVAQPQLDIEVRVLTIFSGIVAETIERQTAAVHLANLSSRVTTLSVLKPRQFKKALSNLLSSKAAEFRESGALERDMRLPFLLLSAHRPDPEDFDPAVSTPLRDWLIQTLHHLEWRSFVRSHYEYSNATDPGQGFIGELPGVGMLIVLGNLVSKDDLDLIRNAFPETINRTVPANAPVRLLAWVLDVPAHRITHAARGKKGLQDLTNDIEQWALEAAAVVDDVTGSTSLVHEGEWDTALRRIRRALKKESGQNNSYLHRLAAECSFSLGDWPGALKYARHAVHLSERDLGSGLVRSICQQADAHLFMGDPVRAWDLYSQASENAEIHPLPRYYRGQALLLVARLIDAFEQECRRTEPTGPIKAELIEETVNALIQGAMDDLTSAADLLERWGLIPESYHYRNFHLVPTFLGQGDAYLLARLPGPAASRLQSARRSFPKDDLFFREFVFAKCMEQSVHRHYATLATGDGWTPMRERLQAEFGEPGSV
ncbi:MAG: hypothetical protein V3R94_06330 [Acidobacteriota bacterium]